MVFHKTLTTGNPAKMSCRYVPFASRPLYDGPKYFPLEPTKGSYGFFTWYKSTFEAEDIHLSQVLKVFKSVYGAKIVCVRALRTPYNWSCFFLVFYFPFSIDSSHWWRVSDFGGLHSMSGGQSKEKRSDMMTYLKQECERVILEGWEIKKVALATARNM